MAGNVNKVFLMGRLTRDPEMKSLPSGLSIAGFSIAVNERFKDREGVWQERANFIDCEMFGARADAFVKFHSKGSPVYVEGRLKLDQWQDKEGNKRSKLKVVAEKFEFVGGGGGSGSKGGGGSYGNQQAQSAPAPENYSQVPPDDDIPF